MDLVKLTMEDVQLAATEVARRHSGQCRDVFGVPRGGCTPGALVAGYLNVPMTDHPTMNSLVVDDLVDNGTTLGHYVGQHLTVDALYRKPWSPPDLAPDAVEVDGWIVFPWENDESDPKDAVVRLLTLVGEDPRRPGLLDTPGRVVRAFQEMTSGYRVDPRTILATTFEERCDEMVVVRGIEFTSLCEHHLLPFVGTAAVGYIPNSDVVGLSKIPRVVDAFAHRLQVQERMTLEIAEAIDYVLNPRGVGVVIEARHSCMGCRGVRKPSAEMVTSAMLGVFREKPEARTEFLTFIQARNL